VAVTIVILYGARRFARPPASYAGGQSVAEPSRSSREPPTWVWGLLLAIALGASFPWFARLMNANERPRLLQAIAVVDHGTWAIDEPAARIDPGIDLARAPGGALYPNKPPGATVPAVLAYAGLSAWGQVTGEPPTLRALTWGARLLGAWLPTMLLCAYAWRRFARDHGATETRASIALLVLATPLAAYAHVLFGHSLAALLVFVGVTEIGDAFSADTPSLRRAFVGGLVAASAVVVEYGVVFVALPLGAYVLARTRVVGVRSLFAALLGCVPPLAALALYHDAAFGSPWATGYHHSVHDPFAEIHARGLLGLAWPQLDDVAEDLVSPWGGLLYWAPIAALVTVVGLARARMRGSIEMLHLAVFLVMLAITLGLRQEGGWRVGPRYLVAALPCLIPIGAVVVRELAARPLAWIATWTLVVFSALANALAANLFPHLMPLGNPLADLLVPLLVAGREPWSILDLGSGVVPGTLAVPLVLALALPIRALAGVPAGPRARTLALAGVLGGVALLAAALALPGSPSAEDDLAAVERIWEPKR
jgi:hypothetical protein